MVEAAIPQCSPRTRTRCGRMTSPISMWRFRSAATPGTYGGELRLSGRVSPRRPRRQPCSHRVETAALGVGVLCPARDCSRPWATWTGMARSSSTRRRSTTLSFSSPRRLLGLGLPPARFEARKRFVHDVLVLAGCDRHDHRRDDWRRRPPLARAVRWHRRHAVCDPGRRTALGR